MLFTKRFLMFRLLPAAALLAVLFGLQIAFGLSPAPAVQTANACNPCECENDRRLNCLGNEFYAVYVRERADKTCTLEGFLVNRAGATGRAIFRLTQADMDKLPAQPEQNIAVKENPLISLYKLTSGEFQVNAGPDADGKIYVVRFQGCPAANTGEEVFIPGQEG